MGEAVGVDVVVVGGGPIGLGAAIEARLAGFDVALVEPRTGPVDKACGEGLMPPAVVALRRLGVDVDALGGVPFAGIRYLSPRSGAGVHDHEGKGGRPGGQAEGKGQGWGQGWGKGKGRDDVVAQARFRGGPGLGVRRIVLSAALAARADEVGVVRVVGEAGPGDRLTCDGNPDDGVEVAGVRASWVIGADGLHSPLRHRLGLDRPPDAASGPGGDRRRYGLRRHYAVRPWTDLIEVHWAPDAEAYVTPVGPELVGVAVLGPRGLGADGWWERFPLLAERLVGATPATSLRGAGPLRQRAARRVSGRVLLVGDAAGYLDALTGEGISLGLACAREAVGCLVEGRPEAYEAAWWRVTRRYRLLTGALLAAARRPVLRRTIVPAAAALPPVFAALVNGLG